MDTPSLTMSIDELAVTLDVSVQDIRAKRGAWRRWHNFPLPLIMNRNVYARADVTAWIEGQATAPDRDVYTGEPVGTAPQSLADQAENACEQDVLVDLATYAAGARR